MNEFSVLNDTRIIEFFAAREYFDLVVCVYFKASDFGFLVFDKLPNFNHVFFDFVKYKPIGLMDMVYICLDLLFEELVDVSALL